LKYFIVSGINDDDLELKKIREAMLINKIFAEIYKYLNKSYNIMLGPGNPLIEVLCDYKIDVIWWNYCRK